MKLKNLLPHIDCYYEVRAADNKFIFSSKNRLYGFDDYIITSINISDGNDGPVMVIHIWGV